MRTIDCVVLFWKVPPTDDNDDQLVRNAMTTQLGLLSDNRTFMSTYRLDKPNPNKSRLIVARFQHNKAEYIISAKRNNFESRSYIHLRAMYPSSFYRIRCVLQAINSYTDSNLRYKGSVRLTSNHNIQIGRAQYSID